MKRRILSMLLALSMVFALVACGTNNNGGQNATPGIIQKLP